MEQLYKYEYPLEMWFYIYPCLAIKELFKQSENSKDGLFGLTLLIFGLDIDCNKETKIVLLIYFTF